MLSTASSRLSPIAAGLLLTIFAAYSSAAVVPVGASEELPAAQPAQPKRAQQTANITASSGIKYFFVTVHTPFRKEYNIPVFKDIIAFFVTKFNYISITV